MTARPSVRHRARTGAARPSGAHSDARPAAAGAARSTGFTLPELLLAMAAAAPVCAAAVLVVLGTGRLASTWRDRLADADAASTAVGVLGAELRYVRPDADLGAVGPDSIRMRAFRGVAIVCATIEDAVFVRYRGVREPEPAKDSVLRAATAEVPAILGASGRAQAACVAADGEAVYRWALAPTPPPGAVLLLFESGSYHLAARAFRYRRGAAGRQPLTDERFAESERPFELGPEDAHAAGPPAAVRLRAAMRARPGRRAAAQDSFAAAFRPLNPWRAAAAADAPP